MSDEPNIGLQRTSACGLAAEAGSFGTLTNARLIITVAIAACVGSVVAKAQSLGTVTVDSFGIYRSVSDDRRVEFVKQDKVVEARLGAIFGYHYLVSGMKAGEPITFRMRKRYPAMRMPDGTISRWSDREMPTVVRSDGTVAGYLIFGFDHQYEMVPGAWTLELWHLNDRLVTMTFTVTQAKS